MYIDTTYEGDLMAAAGVSYTLTRESNRQYGEKYNGIQFQEKYRPRTNHKKPGPNGPLLREVKGFGIGISLWIPMWLKEIRRVVCCRLSTKANRELPAKAAPGVMAYCFRLCLSTADDPATDSTSA